MQRLGVMLGIDDLAAKTRERRRRCTVPTFVTRAIDSRAQWRGFSPSGFTSATGATGATATAANPLGEEVRLVTLVGLVIFTAAARAPLRNQAVSAPRQWRHQVASLSDSSARCHHHGPWKPSCHF